MAASALSSASSSWHGPDTPQTARLREGIHEDENFLRSQLYYMALLDRGINNVGNYHENDPEYDKCKKLLKKEKTMFKALIRRAVRKLLEGGPIDPNIPPGNYGRPEIKAYNTLAQIRPEGREAYRTNLSKLVVVKILDVTLTTSFHNELLSVIRQLKILNESYSTSVPLLLVSNYYSNKYAEKVVKEYSDVKLTINVLNQPVFPLVKKIAPETVQLGGAAFQPRYDYHFVLTQHKLRAEQMHMLPQEVPMGWYIPGEVYSLCQHVSSHISARDKEYILLLNSRELEKVVDLKILNYLCEPTVRRRIDLCFEVKNHSDPEVNNVDYLVNIEGKLRVLPKSLLVNIAPDLAAAGMMMTHNMWLNVPFLRTEDSDLTLLRLVSAKVSDADNEVNAQVVTLEMTIASLVETQDANSIAVEVPDERILPGGPLGWLWDLLNPDWKTRHKIKSVLTYFISYSLYHGIIYVMTAGLHERFLKSEAFGAEEEKKERELNLFWVENGVWLILVYLYFIFLTSRRVKMANWSLSPQQRVIRYQADAWQAGLLASTRFIYTGLNRTAEVRKWFGGNPWIYLLPLHGISWCLELAGSYLIMRFIHTPNVMEPVETS